MWAKQILSSLLRVNQDARRARQVLEAYDRVFRGSDGELVLEDLCARFGVFAPVKSADPIELARHEGERRVVLYLLHTLEKQGDLAQKLEKVNE